MTVVNLSKKYSEQGVSFDSVTLREPKFSEYLEFGEVSALQPNGQGGMMIVEYGSVIEAYAPRLIQSPGFECLEDISLADQVAIKDAIVDLFSDARKPAEKPTSSPSDSENASEQ